LITFSRFSSLPLIASDASLRYYGRHAADAIATLSPIFPQFAIVFIAIFAASLFAIAAIAAIFAILRRFIFAFISPRHCAMPAYAA
jgi:hypothetical protein